MAIETDVYLKHDQQWNKKDHTYNDHLKWSVHKLNTLITLQVHNKNNKTKDGEKHKKYV